MSTVPRKGAKISVDKGHENTLRNILKDMLGKGCFDGILIPMRVPACDSYAWILVKQKSLLDRASPVAPVMPVQGAKALKSLTRKGKGRLKIAAIMRPCEIRASIELFKLNQIHLDNITLMSYDCPGALPLSDYIQDPKKGENCFDRFFSTEVWGNESVKPVCRICDQFSLIPSCDLHFGFLGTELKSLYLIPNSEKGRKAISNMKIEISDDLVAWNQKVDEDRKKRTSFRNEKFKTLQTMMEGFEGLFDVLSNCIGCHNCQSVCPICYCRQCYFDSESVKSDSDHILLKAKQSGRLSFSLDRVMFHVGRMTHMSLSCVSCGLCSDACPVDIPLAEMFSYVADYTQSAFEYRAGMEAEESLPMKAFQFEEVGEIKELVESAEA